MSSDTTLALGGISFTAAAVVLNFLAMGSAVILVNIGLVAALLASEPVTRSATGRPFRPVIFLREPGTRACGSTRRGTNKR